MAADQQLLCGRYLLERVVGRGGQATVWMAYDQRLQRPVAVKILSDTLAQDSVYVRRFAREAHVAAGLSHPNLVLIYDIGDDPRPFLVMQYVAGGTLADALSSVARYPGDARGLARDLLGALQTVHDAGIVHRDIKPANVLLGEDGRAYLTDFGIARYEDLVVGLTQPGMVLGSLRYMAPETKAGDRATVQSDLYAAGRVLAECGDPSLREVTDQLCDADPGRRPESATQALALLESTSDRTALMIRPTHASAPPPVPPATARRWPVAAGCLGLLAAAGIVTVFSVGAHHAKSASVTLPRLPARTAPLRDQVSTLQRIVTAAQR